MGAVVENDPKPEGRAPGRLRRWLDRLLPAVCLVCGDPMSGDAGRVCGVCWSRARRQRAPRCGRCGISLRDIGIDSSTSSCTECRDWLPYLRQARAPFVMGGTAAAAVHALKFGGWTALAAEMGERMAGVRFDPVVESELVAVIPVPLSAARLRERGYNQAELLAQAVAAHLRLPVLAGVLLRGRHTRRQARLSPRERQANVAGVFRVTPTGGDPLRNAHVLLVDDVLTTAATAQDCVRALCGAGARAVSVLTFARARPDLVSGRR